MTGVKPKFRKKTFFTWLVVVGALIALYLTHRETVDVEIVRALVDRNRMVVIPIYLAVLSLLGLTFIPSTPFAIAGVILFDPAFAYLLNLVGILTSSTIVYHFARYLGLGHAFESRYPKQAAKIRGAFRNRELPIIMGWSFFPAVPTDLMIYVASSLEVPLWKCLLGVVIGEGTLNAVYLFGVGAAF